MASVRTSYVALTALIVACGDDSSRDPTTTTATPTPSTPSTPATAVSDGDVMPITGDAGTAGNSQSDTTMDALPVTLSATDDTSDSDASDTNSTGDAPCMLGEVVCAGNTAQVCDGMGGFTSETSCPMACADDLGCVLCVPGDHQCADEVSQVCDAMGAGWLDEQQCDPVQGLSCDPSVGVCLGACASLDSLSYIGCDYYPVVTQQLDDFVGPGNPYAVTVANTSANVASITVTRGGAPVMSLDVQPNSVGVIALPWVDELARDMGLGASVLVADGAYRLRSNQPVTVYQYNMLNADMTNDASLLLPVNTWTGNYLVAAWYDWSPSPAFASITARHDNTTVTVKAPGDGKPTWPGGGIDSKGNGVVVMNEGDVLQIVSTANGDPTGTLVNADKPIQVLGGHDCTQVPLGTIACDHLEEAMFPIEALATEYIVVPPVQFPDESAEKAVVIRVIASEADTTLTFDPDQGVNTLLANVGDFVEIPATVAKFVVKADKKILVAEYMVGQGAGYGTSDPAMVLVVPSVQYRSSYLFYAQPNWTANFVDIIAPTGSNVTVDGAPVGGFTVIGNTAYSLAHVKLSNAGDGGHNVMADKKVGISVYGVLEYGSYWYPGGLDLAVIPQ